MVVFSQVQSAKCKMQRPMCKVQTSLCKVRSRQSDDKLDLWNIAFIPVLTLMVALTPVSFEGESGRERVRMRGRERERDRM